MFERILVPLDGSPLAERALPIAARIALATGGTITLLYAIDAYSPYWSPEPSFADRASARNYFYRLARSETLAGIKTGLALIAGGVVQTILSHARLGVDLIVMCSQNSLSDKREMRTSVAEQIIRHAPIPVLILRYDEAVPALHRSEAQSSLRAIVSLDGSAHAEAILEPVIRLVVALSTPAKGTIHLLRVVHPSAVTRPLNAQDQGSADEAKEKVIQEAEEYLVSTLDSLQRGIALDLNLSFTFSVAQDKDAAQAIIREGESAEYAEKWEQFIAMSTHGRSGLQRLVKGSVTERVLHGSRLPLFIVCPTY